MADGITIPSLDLSELLTPDALNGLSTISAAGGPEGKTQVAAAIQQGISNQMINSANKATALTDDQINHSQEALAAQQRADAAQADLNLKNQMAVSSRQLQITNADQQLDLTQQIQAADQALGQQLNNIHSRQQNGIFDNPLQWVYDQFALPSDIEAYNTQVAQRNQLATQKDTAYAAATDAANFEKSTQLTSSAAILQDRATQQMQENAATIDAARAKLAVMNLPILKNIQDANQQGLTNSFQAYSLGIAKQNADRANANEDLRRQILQSQLDNIEGQQALLDTYNKKYFPSGQGINAKIFANMPQSQKEGILTVALAGMGDTNITPVQAYQAFKAAGTPQNTPQNVKLMTQMDSDWNAFSVQASAKYRNVIGMDNKAKQENTMRDAAVMFNQKYASYGNSLRVGNETGIGYPTVGQLESYRDSSGQPLINNDLWKSYVGTSAGANPQTQLSTQQLLDTANGLIAKGADPRAVAVQMSSIYKAITATNGVQTDWSSFGMTPPAHFTVAPPNSQTVVDLADTNSTYMYLVREKARQNIKVSDFMTGFAF